MAEETNMIISEITGMQLIGLTDDFLRDKPRLLVGIKAAAIYIRDKAHELHGTKRPFAQEGSIAIESDANDVPYSDMIIRNIGDFKEIDVEWTDPITKQVFGLGIEPSVWKSERPGEQVSEAGK